jgi:hypothetical protein
VRGPHAEKVQALLKASPHIKQAPSLGELAERLGVPSMTFVETISRYNRAIDDGLRHDPECHRPLKGRQKIAVPPFYALHYVPLARKNFGGVKTNLRCQVLDKHYQPIPGLYAAGDLTGMAANLAKIPITHMDTFTGAQAMRTPSNSGNCGWTKAGCPCGLPL